MIGVVADIERNGRYIATRLAQQPGAELDAPIGEILM
jgi:hypothetical protein